MSLTPVQLGAAHSDDDVDTVISACLNPAAPRSFFVYAGAGSGKTSSLKLALDNFLEHHGAAFRHAGRRIAVITYTRAAAQEIADRVGDDPLFPISTIHSFCWSLIGGHHTDIRAWLLTKLPQDFAELQAKQEKGRGGQASRDRERAMATIQKRLDYLGQPRTFTYNPNGDNFGTDSLSHAEVLAISADFITSKPGLQAVLVNTFPFILIDESQDTAKGLIAALFHLADLHKGRFGLGLLGDTMQRIYGDGQADLGLAIPDGWASPVKRMNHRSGRRIVQLANAIRAAVDDRAQWAREDSIEGVVRFFVGRADALDKPALEQSIHARMAAICEDEAWDGPSQAVKTLALEHHMAAARRGFSAMFSALDADKRLSPGLRRGDLSGLRLFSDRVAPLVAALQAKDRFAAMSLLRANSPLLKPRALAQTTDPTNPLGDTRKAIKALIKIVDAEAVTFGDVLKCVAAHGLFDIPTSLLPFVGTDDDGAHGVVDETEDAGADIEGEDQSSASAVAGLAAWRTFLNQPFAEIVAYAEYIADQGPYGTHQGVKGLEFDRVLVIMDDAEARGFLFSYEKLFGAKPLSAGDLKNAAEGLETGIDRTRRLLYVTATRARKSLALVAYSEAPQILAKTVVDNGWFKADEVEIIT